MIESRGRRTRVFSLVLAGLLAAWCGATPVPAAAATSLTSHAGRHPVLRPVQKRLSAGAGPSRLAPLSNLGAAVGGSWASIGPQPIVGLETYGKTSGRITALAAHGSTVYAGTADGGVWKTSDGGTTWSPLTDGQATLAIGGVAVDWGAGTNGADIVYAATGEGNRCYDCLPSQGILKSLDGGATWSLLANATFTQSRFFFASFILAVDTTVFPNVKRLFGATNRGLYYSDDGANSWTLALSGDTNVVAQAPDEPKTIWAAQADSEPQACPASGAVDVSTNFGASFGPTPSLTTTAPLSRIGLGVGQAGVVYAALADCQGALAAIDWRSDAHPAWVALGLPPTDPFGPQSQGWYDNVVAVDSTDPLGDTAVFGGVTMFATADGGATYTDISQSLGAGPVHVDFHAVAFTGSRAFYTGNDGGVWSTPDLGNTWSNLNNTLSLTQFYHGTSVDLNHLIGGSQDNGTTGIVPGGPAPPAWPSLVSGDGMWTAMIPGSTTAYTSAAFDDIVRFDYASGAETEIAPCMSTDTPDTNPICGDRVDFVAPFVLDPAASTRLYAATDRVYTTGAADTAISGGPNTWSLLSPDLTQGGAPSGGLLPDFVHTLAAAKGASGTVLLTGSWDGKVFLTTNALSGTSTSGWIDVTGNLPADQKSLETGNSWITAVALNPNDANEAWVAIGTLSGQRVWHTTAVAGGVWTDITGTIPNTIIDSLTVDPLNPSTLYAGTDSGPLVWCTTCGGPAAPAWVPLGAGLPNARVDDITLTRDGGTLVAWTHGRGAWTLPRPFPTPQASLSPSSLYFRQAINTTSASQAVTLTNSGTAPLTITAIAATPSQFAQTNNCPISPATLAPALSCTINVTFRPSAEGAVSGSVMVTDNAADSPQSVSFTGFGFNPLVWESRGGYLTSGPGSASWASNRLDVFVRGRGNNLYHKWFDGSNWTAWENLGGTLTSDPAAVSWGPGRIDVFVRGADMALWHMSWHDGGWSGWDSLGGYLTSGPAVSSWAAGRLDVFVSGPAHGLWHKSWHDGAWSGWDGLGGYLTSDPAAVSWASDRIDVFIRGSDNALWHKSWHDLAWSGWDSLGGTLTSRPGASSWGTGRLDVFVRGPDGQAWHKTYSTGAWIDWQPMGGSLTSGPSAASTTPGIIDVFVRGPDFALWQKTITG